MCASPPAVAKNQPRLLELLDGHDDGVQVSKVLELSLLFLGLPKLHLLSLARGPASAGRGGVRHAAGVCRLDPHGKGGRGEAQVSKKEI